MKRVDGVGIADTKGDELDFTARQVAEAGGVSRIVDLADYRPHCPAEILAQHKKRHGPDGADIVVARFGVSGSVSAAPPRDAPATDGGVNAASVDQTRKLKETSFWHVLHADDGTCQPGRQEEQEKKK